MSNIDKPEGEVLQDTKDLLHHVKIQYIQSSFPQRPVASLSPCGNFKILGGTTFLELSSFTPPSFYCCESLEKSSLAK
ncbi:hypothetical protein [Bdellovibrio sp. HCB2-146]|uniref:hypothetical protein n=1 Tax=Bdellovibrio sp. HCB2-146 TaxID=3394362 RepID=UPI0039BD8683